MGRPLKIAKAQAVLTITATNGTTEVVTVSQNLNNLGVIAGMPFVPASTVGGLTGGTTYWILQVLSSTTFTVSATQLSANPTYTPVNLSTAGPVTVAATVGLVDYGFSNPNGSNTATNSTSYGVVGGNTTLYGSQVLCNVSIGVAGTGTVFADTGSDIVTGLGTDFANVPAGTQMFALWGNDPNTPMLLGTTSASGSNVLVGLANTNATGNIIGVDVGSDATDLVEGGPVVFDVSAGGIVAGQTYFVDNVANSSAFTISATPGGPQVALTTDASVAGNAGQEQIVLDANSANNASGVDGYGDPFAYATLENGYIVRQKGKTKYLVTGLTTGLTGACYTANVANTALTPNTMTITATYANTSTAKVQSLNDYQSEVFPTTVAAGSLTPGVVYTIESAGDTNWTAVGAFANMTGITFTATAAGSGTGTAIVYSANPDVIATFGTAYAANTYGGQPNPIVTISNA